MPYLLTTLIYAQQEGRVLLMQRHKEPNMGLWVAPGGKIEAGESPRECALRELREETGLHAAGAALRAIITEVSPLPDWQWLMFVYRTGAISGAVTGDEREGRLRWFPVGAVLDLPVPQADAIFYPLVMGDGPPLEMKFYYGENLELLRWQKTTIAWGGGRLTGHCAP